MEFNFFLEIKIVNFIQTFLKHSPKIGFCMSHSRDMKLQVNPCRDMRILFCCCQHYQNNCFASTRLFKT